MAIFIPGNVPSSKNGRVWTGKYFIPSKSVDTYYKESHQYWVKYKDEFKDMIKDLEKPYKIKFKFIRRTLHAFDYINPLQTIQDRMINCFCGEKKKRSKELRKYPCDCQWLEDDNADILIPKLLPYELHHEAGVWISI